MFILLLIFIIVPLAEIALFIEVGKIIGLWATIGIVIVTAIIGTSLLKWQGRSVLARTQDALNKGEIPVDSVVDGLFLIIAGALLLTPGLITDTLGFLLFIPQFRRMIAKEVFKRFVAKGNVRMSVYSEGYTNDNQPKNKGMDNGIIDAEYSEIRKDNNDIGSLTKSNPDSPWKNNP